MIHRVSMFCVGLVLLGAGAAPRTEITAALPVIPDAKFNLADYGGVGDYKTFNTDAFKNAVAAIAKAGGGHLIVPAGTYKTLPFVLTSHMDLHLEAGATIKAPDTFAEYGIPDPNQAAAQPGGTERIRHGQSRALDFMPQRRHRPGHHRIRHHRRVGRHVLDMVRQSRPPLSTRPRRRRPAHPGCPSAASSGCTSMA